MNQEHIRNFCIIAHIDHGKSTLADRLLEVTSTVEKRQMREQVLDKMDLEREKGITIKLAPVRMMYGSQQNHGEEPNYDPKSKINNSGVEYQLNLIDTPGHVDFSYEVSRSLEACEGALLVVDATQGIQAQTLANVYLAMGAELTIIPVLNKIDLPAAQIGQVTEEIISLLGCKKEDILLVSAKTGEGVGRVLQKIVSDIPPPSGNTDNPTKALIFDSYYDDYRGVVLYVRVVDGALTAGSAIQMMATKSKSIALEVGSLNPNMSSTNRLATGEIGYVVTNLKTTRDAKVGDTLTLADNPSKDSLPGYKNIKPFVYAGFFPETNEDFNLLKEAIEKLSMSDSALQFEPESSPVLGFGVRIGFLGLLHMDIVKERLEREYGLSLIVTNPSTDYEVKQSNGEELTVKSAAALPDQALIEEIREPWVDGEIIAPKEFVGPVLQLLAAKRGEQKNISYVDERLAVIDFKAPLANLLTDFYDQLKNITSGYGTFNYELSGYFAEDLVKLDFYVANEKVEALSLMAHRSEAQSLGRRIVGKLKEIIPRQNFKVSLQAAIAGKFIAREDLSAYRKDVTTGLYGGDVTRKKKVLAKQAKGKKRMKRFGKVDIPSEAFTALLKRD